MVGNTPPPVRASDADRERTVRALRERSAEGQLSFDSFVRRIDRAFRARSRDELAALLDDLPPQGRVARRLTEAASALSAFTLRLQAAWHEPRLPQLVLPEANHGVLTIGRAEACNLVLSRPTVSRYHAELRCQDGQWLLVDLGSTNGTSLNGWRVDGAVEVRPGDQVTFGDLRFRLARR
ncbi:MAG TPA: DUF1707 and FHA domain-containing protein [Actinomycetes bacterium]